MSRLRARIFLARAGSAVARLDRRALPHRMILGAIPRAATQLFDPQAAGDLEAAFELRISGPGGGEPTRFRVDVADGRCQVRRGTAADAAAAVDVAAGDLVRMASGAVGWPALLAGDRLELSGNPFLALRFPGLFRLPAVATGPGARGAAPTPLPGRTPSSAHSPQSSRSSRSAATSG